MEAAFGDSRYDIVFDQIGYAPDDIADAVEVFSGKIGRYVFTSTGSVYGSGDRFVESDFDPMSIDPGTGRFPDIPYGEGKRKAEAYLFQKAPFPAAAARLPIVIGPDDVTNRFQFHVERVINKKPIVVPFPRGKMAYISADDAGRFIAWLGLTGKEGIYNGSSRYALDAAELTERVGQALDIKPIILEEGPESDISPYATTDNFVLDPTKAESAGFHFTPFDEWFPVAIQEAAKKI
jgi:nucleoside-diphosphate-sugar epimerase